LTSTVYLIILRYTEIINVDSFIGGGFEPKRNPFTIAIIIPRNGDMM
jgi:hypothetical protein